MQKKTDFRKIEYLQIKSAVIIILPRLRQAEITLIVRGWACGSVHPTSQNFSKIFYFVARFEATIDSIRPVVKRTPLQQEKDGNAMNDQIAERILLDLLTFTAAQLKAFAENEAVAGKLDASLLAQLDQSPEDLLQAN